MGKGYQNVSDKEAMDQFPFLRSNLLQNLLVCMHLKENIKVISDLAFDAVDDDGSGGLDQKEIAEIMREVAIKMDLTPPTEEDLSAILAELDEDFDGVVDKNEFLNLIMLVISKMLESEEELQEKVNEDIKSQLKKDLYID
uniref:EF-hand domain-containing protein n=1 Tax=Strombidium rassoulzadegani TaxID=1082188 RepID=A0A7S3FWP8_9SPIT|mmetsp:Transcript_14985/g.25498  ORF Transcript_14985/g.25498 Transcript_14985/m.25498 type:complete len:141 (+) Transcript_14985:350-772(+)